MANDFVPVFFNQAQPAPTKIMPSSVTPMNEKFWMSKVGISVDTAGVHLTEGGEMKLYGPTHDGTPMTDECQKTPVYAGAFGFITNGDKFLVVQKKKDPKWFPPGGMLRTKENLTDACRREVREETNVDVSELAPKFAYESMMPRDGKIARHNLMVYFHGSTTQTDLVVNDTKEIGDAKWVTVEEFSQMQTTEGTRFCISQWMKG